MNPHGHHGQSHYPQGHHGQGQYAQAHHGQGQYAQVHHGQGQYAQVHHGQGQYAQVHHGQGQYAQAHQAHPQAHHVQAQQPLPDFLTDGYISYTFGPQMAEFFLVQLLFKVPNSAAIEAIPDSNGSGAFYSFNHPSHFTPAPRMINGRGAWVLDYDARRGGSVVPQELWVPQGQGDRRRYVDQAQFRMPVFFVGANGNLGVPVLNAAAGDMQLQDAQLPPPLQDKTTAKIRIAWPGYVHSEGQVQLRDQTAAKNPIPFNRVVKHVASRVRQFLAECERVPIQQFNWMLGNGNISSDEVMLIGIVQVSEGSWMPILQLMRRVVM